MSVRHQAIWFNKEDQDSFSDVKMKGLTTQSFKDFVKSAFREKLDKLNIAEVAREAVQRETREAMRG